MVLKKVIMILYLIPLTLYPIQLIPLQDFTYTPLFPKYIWRIDTVVIENNTIVDEKKLFLFVGGEVGGNIDAFNLSPVIGVGTTKGNMYSYRYGLLDKTHNITFSKKLSFKLKR